MSNAIELDGVVSVKSLARHSNVWLLLLLRWLGAWIDFVFLAAFVVVPDYFLGNDLYQQTLWVWLCPMILYFPIMEGIWGRSVGKLITGLIVVDQAGHAPGLLKATLRTIPRIIEVNPLLIGGIIAGIAVAVSKERQRLGDMLAGTYVVRCNDLKSLNLYR